MYSKAATAKGQTTLFQNWGYYGNQRKESKSCVILNEDDPITIDDDLQEVDEAILVAACDQAEGCFKGTTTISSTPEATPLECLPGFDVSAGKIWIYPTNYSVRDYQFNIVSQALQKNTLVTLPTGLGKTFIAAVVMFNFYRWYPQGKVVFMAPTKPLVAQQIEACFHIMGIPQSDMAEMTGSMSPLDRKKMWKVKRVFFLTPQVLTNDLSRQACPAVDVKCLVVDEAHKALGNHAYCEVVRELSKYTPDFRVLALSATPGGDLKAVQQVLNNLLISHVEIRSEESIDIQQYVHERKVEKIVVPLGEELKQIQKLYLQMLSVYVQRLSRAGALFSKDPAHLSKFQLLRAREAFRQDPPPQVQSKGAVEGDFAIGLSLYHGYELLMQHGTRTLYNFLLNTVSEEKGFSRTRQELMRNGDFISVMNVLKEKFEDDDVVNSSLFATAGNSPVSHKISSTQRSKKFVVSHPKMQKLQEIVVKHFRNHQSAASSVESPVSSSSGRHPADTRVMIFAQYRDSVHEIAAMLNCHGPLVRCMSFVGQSSAGKATKGISQKEQLRVVKEFRCGNYNTLVSTCVGEEGLDIGDVDLIVCYDAHKSPTRLVQRMGRTGRKRQGRIVMLMTEGKEASCVVLKILTEKSSHFYPKGNLKQAQVYDKSQYSRRGIHKALQGNSKSLQLYPSSPRMIPRGLSPQPHKMFIKVEEYKGNQKRGKGVKKPGASISAFMKKGKDKSKSETFLSEEELAEWSSKYKLKDEETQAIPTVPSSGTFYSLVDAEKTSSDKVTAPKQPELSLSSWSLWQTKQQPAHLVSHSVKCKNFVELMEFMEVQDQIEGDDIYGMEMTLHLNERDVIKAPTGIQKFCQKTILNRRTEGETCSVDSKSDVEEDKMDSMENVRRSKKRQPLPLLISDESEDEFQDNSAESPPDIQICTKESVTEETSNEEKSSLCEINEKEDVTGKQGPREPDVKEDEERSDEAGSRKHTSEEDRKVEKRSEVAEEVEDNLSNIFPCSQFSFCVNTSDNRKKAGIPLPPSPPSASALDALDDDIERQIGGSRLKEAEKTRVRLEQLKEHRTNSENTGLTQSDENNDHDVDKENNSGVDVNVSHQVQKQTTESFLGKDDDAARKEFFFHEEDIEDLLADDWSINEPDVAPADILMPNIQHQNMSPSTQVGGKSSFSERTSANSMTCVVQTGVCHKPDRDVQPVYEAAQLCNEEKDGEDVEDKQPIETTKGQSTCSLNPAAITSRKCSPTTTRDEISDLCNDVGVNFDLQFDLDSLDDEDVVNPSAAVKCDKAGNNNNGSCTLRWSLGQPGRAVSTPLVKQSPNSLTNPSPALTPVTNVKCRKRETDTRVHGSFVDVTPPRTDCGSGFRDEKRKEIKSHETKTLNSDSPNGPIKSLLMRKLSFCNTDVLSTSIKTVAKRKALSETAERSDCKKKKSVDVGTPPLEPASQSDETEQKLQGREESPVYISDGNDTQEFQVDQGVPLNDVSDDEPLSQIPKPKKRCRNVLKSPEDSSPNCDVTKPQRKKTKYSRKVFLQSSSDEDFDLTSPVNLKSRRKLSAVGRVLQSDEDTDTSPQVIKDAVEKRLLNGRNGSRKERFRNQQNKKTRQKGGQRFLDEEAAVSENESISSDETEGSILDHSLDGFINDATLASQPSPSGKKDMQAVYMKSIRSPAPDAILHPMRNCFKMSHGSGFHGNIYSQAPQQDDTYAEDSFVVEGEEGDHANGGDHAYFENTINVDNIIGGRGCKRLRNTRQGESRAERILRQGRKAVLKSNSSDEDLEVEIDIRDKNQKKSKGHVGNVASRNQQNVTKEPRMTSKRENVVKGRVIDGNSDDVDADDEDESHVRINFDLDFESCVEKKSSARDSLASSTSVYTKEEQQREERLRMQKEKQAEFRKKMAAKRKTEGSISGNQCNMREVRGYEDSQGFDVTPEQNGQKQSMHSGKPSILISSKELSSSSSIVSTLAIKHQMDPRVCQLRGCDFMVSMRMGVEKLSLSEFSLSCNKAKLVERLKEMQELCDKVCIIIEKDRMKRDEKPKPFIRTKYFDSTLAALAKTQFKVLFSDSSDETALVLAELAQVEARKGFAMNFPRELSERQEQVFEFCLSIPGINYAAALSLTFSFPSLVELINSSEDNLLQRTGISEERARNIFRHFRHEFDEQMMGAPKR